MSERKVGMYWHVHHDVLVEWCYDYDERANYIRTHKPEGERELRLRLFQPVRGALPATFVAAVEAYNEAQRAYVAAGKAYNEAQRAYVAARKAYNAELIALHAVECPNCPWDGKTMLRPPRRREG